MADIVIGSGPAGIAAAAALLSRGRRVILLDGGRLPEPEAEARRAAAAEGIWDAAARARWQAPQFAARPGQVRKFGSDFAMEEPESTFSEWGAVALRASRAAGGLSNLWGSAILPYARKDMAGWPVTAEELAPHYSAVLRLMPVSARQDGLTPAFPAISGAEGQVPPSLQAESLMKRLSARSAALAKAGVTAGFARQAVSTSCRLCGQCLHGCPWGHVWSARQTLSRLRGDALLDYRPGSIVTRFSESADGVTLHLDDGSSVSGERAFLGAGVLETARILLASRPAPSELVLRDSQQAFLPALHPWRLAGRPDRGAFHTLPQIFLEIDDAGVSPFLVHAQVYTWNEFFPRDLIANYGHGLPGAAAMLSALARRLIVAQVFLHSDHSHRIALRLGADGRLEARVLENAGMAPTLDAALRRMSGALRLGGLVPLRAAARPGAPGSSFHVGASVPMAREAGPGQSDRLGRPAGLARLHVVDASSLPAIPATTITLSVMANAHRIAAEAP